MKEVKRVKLAQQVLLVLLDQRDLLVTMVPKEVRVLLAWLVNKAPLVNLVVLVKMDCLVKKVMMENLDNLDPLEQLEKQAPQVLLVNGVLQVHLVKKEDKERREQRENLVWKDHQERLVQ